MNALKIVKFVFIFIAVFTVYEVISWYVGLPNSVERENRKIGDNFLDSHGTWRKTVKGYDWNLSGITDISVDEFSLIRLATPTRRSSIRSIDLSNTGFSDEHLQYLPFISNAIYINLQNTIVTERGIEVLIESPAYFAKPRICHSLSYNYCSIWSE